MKIVAPIAAVLVALSLAGCGSQNATVEDCVNYYVGVGKPLDAATGACNNMWTSDDFDQEEMNRLFLN